jgi:hypothetical protein
MAFDLDLAVVYACALVLFYWITSWLLPIAARALFAAVRSSLRRIDGGSGRGSRLAPPRHLPKVRLRPLF